MKTISGKPYIGNRKQCGLGVSETTPQTIVGNEIKLKACWIPCKGGGKNPLYEPNAILPFKVQGCFNIPITLTGF